MLSNFLPLLWSSSMMQLLEKSANQTPGWNLVSTQSKLPHGKDS